MNKEAVELSIWIAAPRGRVWQAVTDPEQIAQWFLPPVLGAQMKRNDSGRLFVCMGPMDVAVARFEVVDEPRQVTIRNLPDELIAVTYTLAEEQGGTRVTVTLSGFEALPEEARQERLGPSGTGWEKALANLKAYVDGTELPFPQGYVAALLGYRRETKQTFAVERSIWIKAPRERVWRAITDPEQIQQWFSPGSPWRLTTLQVGGQLSVYDPETDTDSHIEMIELVDPPHQFRTRSVPQPPETPQTTIWTLAEEKGGTRLTITNAGYELVAADVRHPTMEQNAFGFGMMLENLQAFVEGASVPYPYGF
jgi:uncharacterized protein YndB with AHSA1/START domain